jgi:hypothetical protein
MNPQRRLQRGFRTTRAAFGAWRQASRRLSASIQIAPDHCNPIETPIRSMSLFIARQDSTQPLQRFGTVVDVCAKFTDDLVDLLQISVISLFRTTAKPFTVLIRVRYSQSKSKPACDDIRLQPVPQVQ